MLMSYYNTDMFLLLLATIENFNVVETLSDNAAIVYQLHKVRAAALRALADKTVSLRLLYRLN